MLGFTLIELMITVAVIAILAAIAYPSYTQYVQEARRTDGMSALSNLAGQLERCYTVSNDYTAGSCPSGTSTSDEGFYSVSITASASSYTLTASPQGAQSTDDCGNLTLNHQGVRTPDGCW
ncbi:type IV pilin protein [Halomonas beimenensis]|uniref:Type IV pilus biogenesis protein PilE n=1 Tax=Halomonas beimenensis TaxID=475662 RepID=A0A291PBV6_9GAMM|nr:type IV pilin protein [Halomonas beimenensis]ATJ84321.1 type IV pilus biogenesis protein PilE [Halomonas beimenensis]